jgi:hypothetical protein
MTLVPQEPQKGVIMPRKRALTPGTSPRHFFGSEVRCAREAASMSQAQLGKIANCDDSAVSRVEAGDTAPPEGFPEACDVAFPGMNGFFTRFWDEHEGWTDSIYPRWVGEWMKAEDSAVTLRIWQPLIFPGLLQTPAYARALFLGSQADLSDEALEAGPYDRITRNYIPAANSRGGHVATVPHHRSGCAVCDHRGTRWP